MPMPTVNDVTLFAVQVKPILECLAILGGGIALFKWICERRDRGTDVLLQLEAEFATKCAAARILIENDLAYAKTKEDLACSARQSEASGNTNRKDRTAIDDLLRFYVLLFAVREAHQLPERSLSVCYRYWLAHYYRKDRQELRWYVNALFPTLKDWLIGDAQRKRRPFLKSRKPFFCPEHFWEPKDFDLSPEILTQKPADDFRRSRP